MAANLSKRIITFSNGEYLIEDFDQTLRPMWFVPHDRMRYSYDNRSGGGWRFNPKINGLARAVARENNKSYPEVYRFYPEHGTKLSEAHIQLLVEINPDLSPEKTFTILGTGLAYCNGKWGVLDQPRLMGGAIVTGITSYSVTQGLVDVSRLAMGIVGRVNYDFQGAKTEFRSLVSAGHNILNIATIPLYGTLPDAKTVLADRTLWHWSVGVQPDGDINMWWRRGKDGNMYNVRMFNVSRLPIYSRLDELFRLPEGFLPGPQWMPQPVP